MLHLYSSLHLASLCSFSKQSLPILFKASGLVDLLGVQRSSAALRPPATGARAHRTTAGHGDEQAQPAHVQMKETKERGKPKRPKEKGKKPETEM